MFVRWTDANGNDPYGMADPTSAAFVPSKPAYNPAAGVYSIWENPTVFYAVFTANGFTVHFDVNGGTGSLDDMAFVYDVAQPLPSAEQGGITRSGYSFQGWTTGSDGSGKKYQPGESVKNLAGAAGGTVTLYAYWVVAPYTLTIDANGGTAPAGSQAYPYVGGDIEYELNAGTSIHLPAANAFTRTGYVLDGWATVSTGKVVYTPSATFTMPTSDVTLFAHWTPITYTVSFAPGSSDTTGAMAQQMFTYDVYLALTTNGYRRAGYDFAGWALSASRLDGSASSVSC